MTHPNSPTVEPSSLLTTTHVTHADGRSALRAAHLAPSGPLVRKLISIAHLDEPARHRIHDHAKRLALAARRDAANEGFALALVHRFGLDTPQGVALMQLAEALPRTTDTLSARMLIADKIGTLSWRDSIGKTSNFAQRFALHSLDFFSKTFREARGNKLQAIAQSTFQNAIAVLSRQYVLGETLPQALRRSRKLARDGYQFSFDMLGEAAMTDDAAVAFQKSYLEAVDALASQGSDYAISVKLSALYPRFEERQREHCVPALVDRVKAIAVRARAANLSLTIDAEESDRLELTLDIFEQLFAAKELEGWDGLGLAVQAYQRRAIETIELLGVLSRKHNKRINVRLVKGAYWDTEIKRAQQLGLSDYPVFVRKCNADVSYLACARRLLDQPQFFYPQFATHNAHTLAAIVELATQANSKQYEFQRLHGMGDHVHAAVLHAVKDKGIRSRIYAPIGPRRDLLPYLVRRLLENGASSSFVRQLADTSVSVETLVADPIALARDTSLPRPVGSPTDVKHQTWPAAPGIDLSARDSVAALLAYVQSPQSNYVAAPLINGVQVTGTAQAVINPARRDQAVGHVVLADETHVIAAIAAASSGHAAWTALTPRARSTILENAAQLLEKRAAQFVRLCVLEAGKTLDDAIGEVREAVDFCRYYGEQCRLPKMQVRESLGVTACISPWNFPLAIFLGQVSAALAAGNTVVAKPAEQTPLIAMLATQLLHDAGVPVQALQLITGAGNVGAALVANQQIAAVSFTGSVATAKAIANTLKSNGRAAVPFIAETGGINAMIVDSSALPEQVVRDVLTSAFQSAGQRCSALRVLCLQADIADSVMTLLCGAVRQLRIGDPSRLDTDLGPLIDADAQQQVQTYCKSHTAVVQAPMVSDIADRGFYTVPTVIEVNRLSDVQQEIFGPVLHVARFAASELPTLIQEITSQGYGLTLGVHSRIRQRVQSIGDAARVGNLYVNRHQVGAVVGQQPFGGHGLSGTGPKAGGPHYLLRLSKPKSQISSVIDATRIHILEQAPNDHVATLLTNARKAQAQWERTARRSEMVQFACQLLSANTSQPLGQIADAIEVPGPNDLRIPLASIVGESNELDLKPRGVLLCISALPDFAALAKQILITVATGNGAIVLVSIEHAQPLRELLAFLRQSGVPDHLVAPIKLPHGDVPSDWITKLNIDGVVFDGAKEDEHVIAALLQQHSGAILPMLDSNDIYRFCLEQTVTVNTAAAGGDPQLLGISG